MKKGGSRRRSCRSPRSPGHWSCWAWVAAAPGKSRLSPGSSRPKSRSCRERSGLRCSNRCRRARNRPARRMPLLSRSEFRRPGSLPPGGGLQGGASSGVRRSATAWTGRGRMQGIGVNYGRLPTAFHMGGGMKPGRRHVASGLRAGRGPNPSASDSVPWYGSSSLKAPKCGH